MGTNRKRLVTEEVMTKPFFCNPWFGTLRGSEGEERQAKVFYFLHHFFISFYFYLFLTFFGVLGSGSVQQLSVLVKSAVQTGRQKS